MRIARLITFGSMLAVAAACSDTTASDGMAMSTVRISAADMMLHEATPVFLASVAGEASSIDPAQVTSLMIAVGRIDYLPAGAGDTDGENGDDEGSSWESLTLDADATLDLMNLPAAGESPIVIATGAVPVGDYRKVRLFISAAEIVFADPITIGNAAVFDADTPYPVEVPSAAQTGIKTDVAFSVTADENGDANPVDLSFDPGTSFANVTTTGNGRVKMAPVLRSPN